MAFSTPLRRPHAAAALGACTVEVQHNTPSPDTPEPATAPFPPPPRPKQRAGEPPGRCCRRRCLPHPPPCCDPPPFPAFGQKRKHPHPPRGPLRSGAHRRRSQSGRSLRRHEAPLLTSFVHSRAVGVRRRFCGGRSWHSDRRPRRRRGGRIGAAHSPNFCCQRVLRPLPGLPCTPRCCCCCMHTCKARGLCRQAGSSPRLYAPWAAPRPPRSRLASPLLFWILCARGSAGSAPCWAELSTLLFPLQRRLHEKRGRMSPLSFCNI